MFERFTERARRVMVLAQEEARLLDHRFIGTEHLLLGLVVEQEGVAGHVLSTLGISKESARERVRDLSPPGSDHATLGPFAPPFTPRAKKVLELSLREALQLGHNYIGTEHILLGIVREGEGVGAKVLHQYNNLDSIRQSVIETLSGYSQPKADMSPVPPRQVTSPEHAKDAFTADIAMRLLRKIIGFLEHLPVSFIMKLDDDERYLLYKVLDELKKKE